MCCSYKYLTCGPGAIAAIFVHERHGVVDTTTPQSNFRPRLRGWWGDGKDNRFCMTNSKVLGLVEAALISYKICTSTRSRGLSIIRVHSIFLRLWLHRRYSKKPACLCFVRNPFSSQLILSSYSLRKRRLVTDHLTLSLHHDTVLV